MNKKQFEKYRKAYLESEEWKWVRREVIKRDRKCLRCKIKYSKDLLFDVHHQEYLYFGDADLNEVETCCLLCRACHRSIHGLSPDDFLDNPDFETYEWE
jgi:hypothetical protein